jgi:hypothetical protein
LFSSLFLIVKEEGSSSIIMYHNLDYYRDFLIMMCNSSSIRKR